MNMNLGTKSVRMMVIAILSAIVLITLFLPAHHINGKAFNKILSRMGDSPLVSYFIGYIDINEESVDEEIREIETKYGVKLLSITPGRIITHSFSGLVSQDVSESMSSKETSGLLRKVSNGYMAYRVLLCLIYILAAVMFLISACGCFGENLKKNNFLFCAGCGLIVIVGFGILQFLVPKILSKSIAQIIMQKANREEMFFSGFAGVSSKNLASQLSKIIRCFWGSAYRTGMIASALIVIMSVRAMLAGNGRILKTGGTQTKGRDIGMEVLKSGEEFIKRQKERLTGSDSIRQLENQARQGDVVSMRTLAAEYAKTGENRDRYVYWATEAAKRGDAEAQAMLGSLYSSQKKRKEAHKWYELSAAQNNFNGLMGLAKSYEYVRGKTEEKEGGTSAGKEIQKYNYLIEDLYKKAVKAAGTNTQFSEAAGNLGHFYVYLARRTRDVRTAKKAAYYLYRAYLNGADSELTWFQDIVAEYRLQVDTYNIKEWARREQLF